MSLLYNAKNENHMAREQLHGLPLPQALGRFHHPVPFGEFADQVVSSLDRYGFGLVKDEYAVSKDNNKLFGIIEVEPLEGEYISAWDWALEIGIRGSHDQSLPRGLTLGSQVLVCSNLCFHGNLGVWTTRQTTNVWQRLPAMIDNALAQLPVMFDRNVQRFDAYRQTEFKPRHGDAALVELHRRGAFTASQLGQAIHEWDQPSHEDHAEDGFTIWRLFNASTEALKPTGDRGNHVILADRSMKISTFMDELAGL